MASRRETIEKLFKQETSDSGSLCHGSNPMRGRQLKINDLRKVVCIR